jgi:hypothetical protein
MTDTTDAIRCHLVSARSENRSRLNYRHEEKTDLYYAGGYNLRGHTPKAYIDVCFTP